jgi:hypothetical protein
MEECTMDYKVFPSVDFPGEWVAGAVDDAREGELYLVRFSGPAARERAEEYQAWRLELA